MDTGNIQASLAEFNIVADDFGSDEKSYGYCYWRQPKRFDDEGNPARNSEWITTGPAWPVEYKRQMEKGMVPLNKEYGEFQFPFDKKTNWWVTRDPWWLLLAKGGAKEFPISQIVAFGWDRKRPYRDVVFPQLADFTPPDPKICPICYKRMPSVENAEMLLRNHVMVAHREISQHQQMVSAFEKANKQIEGNVGGPMGEGFKLLATSIQQLSQTMATIAERQRATDERLSALLEQRETSQPSVQTPPAEPAPPPEEVPSVEPEKITYTAPEEAKPNKKK